MSEAILIEYIFSKLDAESQKDWEATLSLKAPDVVDELPTWDEFINFLTSRVRMLQRVNMSQVSSPSQPILRLKGQSQSGQSSGRANSVNHVVSKTESSRKIQCFLCFSTHYLNQCPAFRNMTDAEKWETVVRLKLCENCLSNKHKHDHCTSSSSCRYCQQKHHSSLHSGPVQLSPTSSSTPSPTPSPASVVAVSMSSKPNVLAAPAESFTPLPKTNLLSPPQGSGLGEDFAGHVAGEVLLSNLTKTKPQVLLNTASIWVESGQGKRYQVRALLDSCSMSNFMTQACAKKLGIRRRKAYTTVGGICGTSHDVKDALVATVSNRLESYVSQIDCYVVDSITADLPLSGFKYDNWPIPKNCTLADATFNVTGPIDVMIGMEHWNDIFLEKKIRLGEGLPVLRSTVFGWVVGGPLDEEIRIFVPVNCLSIVLPHKQTKNNKIKPNSIAPVVDNIHELSVENVMNIDQANRNVSSNSTLLAGGTAGQQQEKSKNKTFGFNWEPQSDLFVDPDKTVSNMLCSKFRNNLLAQTTIPRFDLSNLPPLAQMIKSVEAPCFYDIIDNNFISDTKNTIANVIRPKTLPADNVQGIQKQDTIPDKPKNDTKRLHGVKCSYSPGYMLKATVGYTVEINMPPETSSPLVYVKLAKNEPYPDALQVPKSGQVCKKQKLLILSVFLDKNVAIRPFCTTNLIIDQKFSTPRSLNLDVVWQSPNFHHLQAFDPAKHVDDELLTVQFGDFHCFRQTILTSKDSFDLDPVIQGHPRVIGTIGHRPQYALILDSQSNCQHHRQYRQCPNQKWGHLTPNGHSSDPANKGQRSKMNEGSFIAGENVWNLFGQT